MKMLSRRPFSRLFNYYNPFNSAPLGTLPYDSPSQVQHKLLLSHQAFQDWRKLDFEERVSRMKEVQSQLHTDKQQLKRRLSQSLGKSLKDSQKQLKRIFQLLPQIEQLCRNFIQPQTTTHAGFRLLSLKQPLGVSLIFPFYSSPFLYSLIFAWSALLLGNSVLLKPSSFGCWVGQYLQKIVKEKTGLQVIKSCFLDNSCFEEIVQFKEIRQITYAGSRVGGKHLLEHVSKHRFINATLYFNGTLFSYVDVSADLQSSSNQIFERCFQNNGQQYDCLRVVFLHQQIADQVIQLLAAKIKALNVGDPLDISSDLGVLPVYQTVGLLQQLVQDTVLLGANIVCGGLPMEVGTTSTFEPTLVDNCDVDSPLVQQQYKGPVLCCLRVKDQNQFIQQAKSLKMGFGCIVFCNERGLMEGIKEGLQVGQVIWNSERGEVSRTREGWGESGKGRVYGQEYLQEYCLSKGMRVEV